MKNVTLIFALFSLLLFDPKFCAAQCSGFTAENLEGNKVKATLSNTEGHFWGYGLGSGYEVPVGSGLNTAFSGAMWMGGIDPGGNLHVSAQTYGQGGGIFSQGPYRSSGNYGCDSMIYLSDCPSLKTDVFMHSSGKRLIFYPGSYDLFDPITETVVNRIIPTSSAGLISYTELLDGRIFLVESVFFWLGRFTHLVY